MVSSIVNTLGFGSGIDVSKLVSDLAAASREPKVARFDARARTVQTSISAVGQARSNLEGFSKSLDALVAGGELQSQPTVSDATILGAKAKPGARIGSFSGQIEVTRLAKGLTSASVYTPAASDAVGQGTMRIAIAGQTYDVVVDAANDSLNGLATAINASRSGVTASVMTDSAGARLVIKGPTGAANDVTLTSLPGSAPTLGRYTTAQLTVAQSPQDSEFKIDGLTYARPSNQIDDVVPGVALTLKKVAPGAVVTVGIERPAEKLKTTIQDFVSVYNELKASLNAARTSTRNDQGLRGIDRQLAQIVAQSVTSYGTPSSLSDIGVSTNRDGTITLDQAKFDRVFLANPDEVEAIFAPTRDAMRTTVTDPGIGGALSALKATATATNGALASLSSRLGKEASAIAKDRDQMESREASYRARLEKQFGGVDARVGALKAQQSYLDQQIKMWTASR